MVDALLLILAFVSAPLMWFGGYLGYRARGMTTNMKVWLAIAGLSALISVFASLLIAVTDADGWTRAILRLMTVASMGVLLYWYMMGTRRKPQRPRGHA